MQTIDLGSDVVFSVKVGDKTFELREPTVAEIESFKDGDKDGVFNLLATLGMPVEVSKNLPVSKMKKLVDGLVAGMSEKK